MKSTLEATLSESFSRTLNQFHGGQRKARGHTLNVDRWLNYKKQGRTRLTPAQYRRMMKKMRKNGDYSAGGAI